MRIRVLLVLRGILNILTFWRRAWRWTLRLGLFLVGYLGRKCNAFVGLFIVGHLARKRML